MRAPAASGEGGGVRGEGRGGRFQTRADLGGGDGGEGARGGEARTLLSRVIHAVLHPASMPPRAVDVLPARLAERRSRGQLRRRRARREIAGGGFLSRSKISVGTPRAYHGAPRPLGSAACTARATSRRSDRPLALGALPDDSTRDASARAACCAGTWFKKIERRGRTSETGRTRCCCGAKKPAGDPIVSEESSPSRAVFEARVAPERTHRVTSAGGGGGTVTRNGSVRGPAHRQGQWVYG